MANAPLLGKTGEVLGVICPTTEAKYFCQGGLDDPNHVESFEQIKVYAHAISAACRQRAKRHAEKTINRSASSGKSIPCPKTFLACC
jgi:hypothetical protein